MGSLKKEEKLLEFFLVWSPQLLRVNVRKWFGSCAPATGIQLPGCEMMQKAKKGTFQLEIRTMS